MEGPKNKWRPGMDDGQETFEEYDANTQVMANLLGSVIHACAKQIDRNPLYTTLLAVDVLAYQLKTLDKQATVAYLENFARIIDHPSKSRLDKAMKRRTQAGQDLYAAYYLANAQPDGHG